MRPLHCSALLSWLNAAMSQGIPEHPQVLLGPVFLPPTSLQNSKTFSPTLSNLSLQLGATLESGSSIFGTFAANKSSVSVSIASTSRKHPLYTFHSTSSALDESAGGTTKVGDDSVYRIGSISKLFTVYAFLLEGGFSLWNRPVTDFVPELRRDAPLCQTKSSEIDHALWEEVTLGSLASFMAGIGRDYNLDDLSSFPLPWTQLGLPQLSAGNVANCSAGQAGRVCNRAEYFEGFLKRHPVLLAQSSPVYSNTAFRILSYAMEAITGRIYEDTINRLIIQPLGLKNTSVRKPSNSKGIIPQGNSNWENDLGDEIPAGGIYSSAVDLTTLGRAILLSGQLSKYETRRWLKPLSHTSAEIFSVGAPWEIWRAKSNITFGRTVDLYTKSGSVGLYNTLLVLIPDYQITISIMTAGSDFKVVNIVGETILQAVIPALEQAAKDQAGRNIAGRYASEVGNYSMVLKLDDGPGLVAETWISNGSNLLNTIQSYAAATGGDDIKAVRLYPTDLVESHGSGTRVGYRAIFEAALPSRAVPRILDQSFSGWQQVDQTMYGNVAADDFVIDFDSQGNAIAVEPRVLQVTLKRS